ncbi:MAG TPA: excinuclease ABC subunit UvrA, partial [Thermaerobacter sp.]
MARDSIIIRGARQHNLKNINLELPRNRLIVFTGLSGSGKSSLAFDTLYAEGQRRYVESLSAYARQFLGQMDKPDVDMIEGLSPAISIDQKTTSRNPRSTVGTVTEIYDYLRLLYARIGRPHCPQCGRPISQQTVEQMVDRVLELPERTRIQVLAPVVRGRKGEHEKVFEEIRRAGYVRVRIDGEVRDVAELPPGFKLEKNKKHTIEVVVDRIIVRPDARNRLADSIETALGLANGLVLIDVIGGEPMLFSQHFACPDCGISLEELSPRMFSFNSPYGACPACSGLGSRLEIDPELVIPDRRKSLAEGAVVPWSRGTSNYYPQLLAAVAQHFGVSMDTPLEEAGEEFIRVLLYGTDEPIRFRYENRYGRVRERYVTFEGVV